MRKFASVILLAVLVNLAGILPARPAVAAPASFSMNFIVPDDQFLDYLGMSQARIQEFLDNRTGILKSYVAADGRPAAQVIYDAAVANKISPKVLLATIQKESSMITRSAFNTDGYSGSAQYYLDWITFYGWCDSCSTGVSKGFVNQMNSTAAAFRRYLDSIATTGTSISGWGPGIGKSLLCITSDYANGRELCTPGTAIVITPLNAATSALYTYTPHPGGNYAFWKIWNDFNFGFSRKYPDGTLLQAKGSSSIFLLQDGLKRKFKTRSAFLSRYSAKRVLTVSPDVLALYDDGKPIAFANYSVVSAPNRGVYLLVDDTKRPITSGKAFKAAGFTKEEVVKASWDDLNLYSDGESITTDNVYPSGALMQHNKTGALYFVKDGVRYPIISSSILKSQFGNQRPVKIAGSRLARYTIGNKVGFKDGDLVQSRTDTTVYFISNGSRLPIAHKAIYAYGFDKIWKTRIITDDRSLAVHPLGPTLDVDSNLVSLASK